MHYRGGDPPLTIHLSLSLPHLTLVQRWYYGAWYKIRGQKFMYSEGLNSGDVLVVMI